MWKLRRPTVYNEIIPRLGRNELSTVKSRLKPLCSGFCVERGGGRNCNKSAHSYPLSFLGMCVCVCIELQSWNQRSVLLILEYLPVKCYCFSVSSIKYEERERELCCRTLDKLKLHPKQSSRERLSRGHFLSSLFWIEI